MEVLGDLMITVAAFINRANERQKLLYCIKSAVPAEMDPVITYLLKRRNLNQWG